MGPGLGLAPGGLAPYHVRPRVSMDLGASLPGANPLPGPIQLQANSPPGQIALDKIQKTHLHLHFNLFIPALKALSQQQDRWLAWINPPFSPYAPALRTLGVDINKILLVHPKDHKDALWATEKACKSGTCSTVFAWLDESQLTFKDTQRLQIAAKQGNTLSCLFRPQNEQPSMAELRLSVRAMSTDQ